MGIIARSKATKPSMNGLLRFARNDNHVSNSKFLMLFLFASLVSGCLTTSPGNSGNVQSYSFPTVEPQWIRNGEPLEFKGEKWYPQDGTESFLDSEVSPLGERDGVYLYVDKLDVKPYNRIYTKFGKNKFRITLEELRKERDTVKQLGFI